MKQIIFLALMAISLDAWAWQKVLSTGYAPLTQNAVEELNKTAVNQQGQVAACKDVKFALEQQKYPLGVTLAQLKVQGIDRFGQPFAESWPVLRSATVYVKQTERAFRFYFYTGGSISADMIIRMDAETKKLTNVFIGLLGHPCSRLHLSEHLPQVF
jgi:hypothetical protein